MKIYQSYQELTKVSINDSLQIWQDTRCQISTYKAVTMARVRSLFINEQTKCQKSIMCECSRRHCLGKTLTVNNYVKRIMSYE